MLSLSTFRSAVADFISPENRNRRNELERLINVDPLTGLANRRAFELALPAAEADPDTVVIMFDANNFGLLNKLCGHQFGDVVLRDMAGTILTAAEVFGVRGRCFRLGGDEFVVLCPASIAGRLRDQIETSFGVRYPAVGVALVGTIGATQALADEALQARKAARKAA
jgi:GGDEF domain-containing protein